MRAAGKIAIGVSILVVGGLVALAAPTVAAVHGEMSSWAVFASTTNPTKQMASEDDPVAEKMIDELGEDYTYVGNGTAIPKNTPAGCENPAWVHTGRMNTSLTGQLIDQGERDLAAGTPGLDVDGKIVTYTVAPGDVLSAIGDRFCIANPLAIATVNHTRTIQPGEVLPLRPDEFIPWVPYFNPDDAPAGYEQIPYLLALEAMSTAAQPGRR